MGCNCKGERKIEKLFNNNNKTMEGKKGVQYFLLKTLQLLLEALNRLITLSFIIALTPVIIVILIFGYVFKGTLKIHIPFKINKLIKDYYAKKSQDTDELK